MGQHFEFDKNFQIQILSLMLHDLEFLIFAHDAIDPDYFSDTILAWFFKSLRDHYMDYQIKMQPQSLHNELVMAAKAGKIKKTEVRHYVAVYTKTLQKVLDKDYVSDQVITFCKHQAIRKAAMSMPSMLNTNAFPEIESLMAEAFRVGSNLGSIGCQFFQDWAYRIKYREQQRELLIVPTGITDLDILLRGGLRPKQIGIVMSPTSRGKSLFLVHCGKRAVVMGKRVVHYTFELSEQEVSERYDSSFSRIPIDKLVEQEINFRLQMAKLSKNFRNRLIIKEYPSGTASVSTLRSHINQCYHIGFEPDLILVDYIDLMRPVQRRKERREELSDITTELRGMAGQLCVPLWSATQSRRAAISMETHTEEEVGEDIGKVNIADVVITLNQTKEELAKEMMRLFLAKNRNGRRYMEIPIQTAFDRMAFFDPLKV